MPTCSHCLLEFPLKDEVTAEVGGEKLTFCCKGCLGVYMLIHEEGLDRFYDNRKWSEAGIQTSLLSRDIDIKPFAEHVRDSAEGPCRTKEVDIFIEGIRCASCVWLNEKILARTEGVEYARVNYATHKARIKWDPEKTGLDRILKRVSSIGYCPKPYSESEQYLMRKAETRDLLVRFGTAGFLSSQLMIYSLALYSGYFEGIDAKLKLLFEVIAMLLTFPVIFYSGMPFISGTLRGLRHLNFNMDSLIAIGAGSAFIYSIYQIFAGGEVYFDTAAMIITLILLGRYIEATAKGKASETIERLAELTPKEASVVTESGETRKTQISSVGKGELIQVKPGERVPLDGIVREGASEVDESIITGESRPVAKTFGMEVVAGSMNLYGTFIFEVTRSSGDTVLAGIIRAVEDAQSRKPKIQTIADRTVGVFVPLVLLVSFLTVVFYMLNGSSAHHALMTGISVLVIACPCSLGLATPLAILIFTTLASSKGILVRSGEVVEDAGKTDHVMLDKTGTVTGGRPVLKEAILIDQSLKKEEVLALAASVEGLSEHSLGHAITEAAGVAGLSAVSGFRALPGRGVEGYIRGSRICVGNRQLMKEAGVSDKSVKELDDVVRIYEKSGDTAVFISWEGAVRAAFIISDIIRPESVEAVNDLQALGVSVSMMSGDNEITTSSIASTVGIKDALSEVSPVRKKEIIEEMQLAGKRVMMIGDGINDAPALTEARVGIAMGRGTDIAMESADAVLIRNDLGLIPYFLKLSKKTFRIIKQNIFWAFFYNLISVPLAVSGLLHPIIAAAAMAASSLFVVLNSLRIRKGDFREQSEIMR